MVLKWAPIPALKAGEAQVLHLELPLRSPGAATGKWIIAVPHSGSILDEANKKNNLAHP